MGLDLLLLLLRVIPRGLRDLSGGPGSSRAFRGWQGCHPCPQPAWQLQFCAGTARAVAPRRISLLLHHHGQTWLSPVPAALGGCGDTNLPPLGQPEVFAKCFGILG